MIKHWLCLAPCEAHLVLAPRILNFLIDLHLWMAQTDTVFLRIHPCMTLSCLVFFCVREGMLTVHSTTVLKKQDSQVPLWLGCCSGWSESDRTYAVYHFLLSLPLLLTINIYWQLSGVKNVVFSYETILYLTLNCSLRWQNSWPWLRLPELAN